MHAADEVDAGIAAQQQVAGLADLREQAIGQTQRVGAGRVAADIDLFIIFLDKILARSQILQLTHCEKIKL